MKNALGVICKKHGIILCTCWASGKIIEKNDCHFFKASMPPGTVKPLYLMV
jgi:hypothetical protein